MSEDSGNYFTGARSGAITKRTPKNTPEGPKPDALTEKLRQALIEGAEKDKPLWAEWVKANPPSERDGPD